LPHWLLHLGLPGLFALAVFDSSPIPLPLPGSTDLLLLLLVAQRGSHPVWLALTAVAGSVLGGYLTWSAGKKGGEAMLARWAPKRLVKPLTGWVSQRGFTTVAVSALLPPPVPLTPLLLGAGALGVSRGRFLAGLASARAIRYAFVAWVGVTYGRRVEHDSVELSRVDRGGGRFWRVEVSPDRRQCCTEAGRCRPLDPVLASQTPSDAECPLRQIDLPGGMQAGGPVAAPTFTWRSQLPASR
jgi:membrane protein YqaA with SNARE-associated domain